MKLWEFPNREFPIDLTVEPMRVEKLDNRTR